MNKSASSSALFGLDDKDDSDSDSDDDDNKDTAPAAGAASKSSTNKTKSGQPSGGKQFSLNSSGLDAFGGDDDDDDDDDDDEEGEIGGFNTSSWTLTKPEEPSKRKSAGLDDDAWAAARKSAEETKAFEEQRKAREAKMKAEAEEAKKQRLLDAAQRGEEIRAQRQEEEAREAALREQKEKEEEKARQAAREAARAQVNAVEQHRELSSVELGAVGVCRGWAVLRVPDRGGVRARRVGAGPVHQRHDVPAGAVRDGVHGHAVRRVRRRVL